MATFKILQDAEKENPHIPIPLKEKTSVACSRLNALQPSVLGGAAVPFKGKLGDGVSRSNFAVLNPNTNVAHGRNITGGVATGSKVVSISTKFV